MDDRSIEDALHGDVSELSDFEDSGSEYVPSSNEDSVSEDGSLENDEYLYNNDNVENNDEDNEDRNVATNQINVNNNVGPVSQLQNQASNTWGDCTFTVRQYPFTGKPGLKYNFDVSNPLEVFQQFVTDDIINYIVEETNSFAHQTLVSGPVKRRSIMRNWLDCSPSEMRKFLGMIMIMGLNPAPKIRLYWSKNDIYEKPMIKKIMTRDRFDMILKCWHFHNNEEDDIVEPRLVKIKPLVDKLNERYEAVLCPEESIVVDESMIPWRGRLIIRQYNPQKSSKYGVKVYKLCSTEGYTSKIKIYAGKDDLTGSKGHAQKVVEYLVSGLVGEGRILYCDNFYNSIPLAENLLSKKTYVCGTLRADRRGTPKDFIKEKIKKGEVQAKENGNGVKVIKWQDKRRVLMVSTRTEDSANLMPTGKTNRAGEPILKPTAVVGYNEAKKGVDLSDQLSSYYSPLRKTTKWYKKVAVELLLGTSVINAFVIFNKNRQKKWEVIKFREVLLRELIKDEDVPAPIPQLQHQQTGRKRPLPKHKLLKREGPALKTRKRCVQCYQDKVVEVGTKEARNGAKKVNTFCADCPNEPHYCLECFNKTH